MSQITDHAENHSLKIKESNYRLEQLSFLTGFKMRKFSDSLISDDSSEL